MRIFIASFCVAALGMGCKERRPEEASGLLDRDAAEIVVACAAEKNESWNVRLGGWDPVPSEGQAAWVRIAKAEDPIVDEPAVVHYEPETHLTVIFKSGALQTERTAAGAFVGILDVQPEVLEEVTCAYQ